MYIYYFLLFKNLTVSPQYKSDNFLCGNSPAFLLKSTFIIFDSCLTEC